MPVFEELVKSFDAEVHVVSWDKNKLKPYELPVINKVTFYKRSKYNKRNLIELIDCINPDIVYVSGWMDTLYLSVLNSLIYKKIPVVTGFDDQWHGNIKQHIASLFFPFFRKYFFSYAWVAGPYQYEYAKRLGFKNNEIIFNLLSCNTKLFSSGIDSLEFKKKDFPKTFLYVGNFRHVKGTDILIEAFEEYQKKYNGDWKLVCVGNGDMLSLLINKHNVEIISFSNEEELVNIAKRSGIFILPSRSEQWGVVIHEFAAAAMPLILSDNVGAKAEFFIENYNGITYSDNSKENLAKSMYLMSIKDKAELIRMCNNSFEMAHKITPKISAASFMSILDL